MSGIAEIPFHKFQDSIIKLEASTWEQSQEKAISLGGNLVSINSQEEQEFINKTFLSPDIYGNHDGEIGKWIGLTDKNTEGFWEWTDGSLFEYQNWNNGEPNDDKIEGLYQADFALISQNTTPWNTSHIGSWNDHINNPSLYDQNHKISGIAEIKIGPATSSKLVVKPVNKAPELTGEQYSFTDSPKGEAIFISQEQLLQGYTDVDGDKLEVMDLSISISESVPEIDTSNLEIIELKGIISEDINLENKHIKLTGNVQVSGKLSLGNNVYLDGQGFELYAYQNGKISAKAQIPGSSTIFDTKIGYKEGILEVDQFNLVDSIFQAVNANSTAGTSTNGSLSITNSIIKNPVGHSYLHYPESDLIIKSNKFILDGADWRISGGVNGAKILIDNNIFIGPVSDQSAGNFYDHPFIENWADYGAGFYVTNNSFHNFDSTQHLLGTPRGYDSSDIKGVNNSIFNSHSSNYSDYIFDGHNDLNHEPISDYHQLFSLVSTEKQFNLINNNDGTWQFKTDGILNAGKETFELNYNIVDEDGASISASNSFNIFDIQETVPNQPPVVTGSVDLGSILEDGTIRITKADLLANSSDPDGDPLSIVDLQIAEGQGNITINDDGAGPLLQILIGTEMCNSLIKYLILKIIPK